MKILYGVQGTGNGHISRACAMAEAFQHYKDIEITWLLSGRDKQRGCGDITDFIWREGITFVVKEGKINVLDTLLNFNFSTFRQDVNELDLKPFDVIISDFEPVISHAARKQDVPVIGIGHQYAFDYDIPTKGANIITKSIMQRFAPVTLGVGLHWHHFGHPILPPIIDLEIPPTMPEVVQNKVLVYLPFESPAKILALFKTLSDFDFYIYHPELEDSDQGNLHCRAISRTRFKDDLLNSRHVLTNGGFELISECLQIGKSILVKPLLGQMEQLSNAHVLEKLGYARVIQELDLSAIKTWLSHDNEIIQVTYPDVATRLAEWIAGGCKASVENLAEELWQSPYLHKLQKAS